jgi:hypothetical protein
MAVEEGFMGVVVILAAAISVAVAMDGAVGVTGGVAVTDAVGTVECMGVAGTGAVGMVVVLIGGDTHTRMLTDLTVGNSDKQKNLNRSLPAIVPRLRDDGWSIRGSFFRFYLIN